MGFHEGEHVVPSEEPAPGAVMTQEEVKELRKKIYRKIWEDTNPARRFVSSFFFFLGGGGTNIF